MKKKTKRKPERNCNDVKALSIKELYSIIPAAKKLKTKPWKHQLVTLVCCMAYHHLLNSLDVGVGKTKVVLDYFSLTGDPEKTRVLFICQKRGVWKMGEEVDKHTRNWPWQVLEGTGKQKLQQMIDTLDRPGYTIVNYDGVRALFGTLEKKNSKKRWVVDYRKIQKYSKTFDGIIIDESHACASTLSLIYRLTRALAMRIDRRFCLTGTPIGDTLLDLFPQYVLIDRGETFGTKVTDFREQYFEDKGWFGPDWKVTEHGRADIERKMWRYAIRYKDDECEDMPSKSYERIIYQLTPQQKKEYKAASKGILEMGGKIRGLENKFHVLREICSGFKMIKTSGIDPITGEFTKVERNIEKIKGLNPKLEAFSDLIESAIYATKVVVFHEYVYDATIIAGLLFNNKIGFTMLNGAVKNPQVEIKKFQNNDDVRVMVAHPKSGGDTIDLIEGTICIFWNTSGSVRERIQCEGRIRRISQDSHCYFYDLIGEKTVEQSIYWSLMAGKSFFSEVIDRRKLKKQLRGEV